MGEGQAGTLLLGYWKIRAQTNQKQDKTEKKEKREKNEKKKMKREKKKEKREKEISWCAQRCHSVLGLIAATANQGTLGCYSSQPMANTYFQINPTQKSARLRFPTSPIALAIPALH